MLHLPTFFINVRVAQIPCLRDVCRLDRFVSLDGIAPPRIVHSITDAVSFFLFPPSNPSLHSRVLRREDRTVDKGSHPSRLQPLQNESGRRPRGRPPARQTHTLDHRRPTVLPHGRPRVRAARPGRSCARREERRSDRGGAHDRREPGVGRAAGDRLRVLARRNQTLVRACFVLGAEREF